MRFTRQGPAGEMSAAMFVPSLVAIALGAAGVLESADDQLALQHVGMFPAMLVAMLARRSEYA